MVTRLTHGVQLVLMSGINQSEIYRWYNINNLFYKKDLGLFSTYRIVNLLNDPLSFRQ